MFVTGPVLPKSWEPYREPGEISPQWPFISGGNPEVSGSFRPQIWRPKLMAEMFWSKQSHPIQHWIPMGDRKWWNTDPILPLKNVIGSPKKTILIGTGERVFRALRWDKQPKKDVDIQFNYKYFLRLNGVSGIDTFGVVQMTFSLEVFWMFRDQAKIQTNRMTDPTITLVFHNPPIIPSEEVWVWTP